jgi:hypothetical protein
MLDVGPVDVPPGKFEIRLDRFARVVGIPDDQAADDEQPGTMQVCNRFYGGIPHTAAMISSSVLRAGLQEVEIVFENIFDTEEDIPKPCAFHQGCQRCAMLGERGGHCLDEILDIVEPGVDDRRAQGFKPMYVERDVVVDQEDCACAVAPRVRNVGEHPIDRKYMKVAAAHFDDRAETAVKGAPSRRFDDVYLAPHQGIAVEDARRAVRQAKGIRLEAGDGAIGPVNQSGRCSTRQAGDWLNGSARIQRTKQLTQRMLSFATDEKIHL